MLHGELKDAKNKCVKRSKQKAQKTYDSFLSFFIYSAFAEAIIEQFYPKTSFNKAASLTPPF